MPGYRKVLRFTKENKLQEEVENTKPTCAGRPETQWTKNGGKFLRMMSLVSELGLSISLPIVGGAILGQFLDNKFYTSPKATLSLIFLGLFLGSANIYMIIKRINKDL